MKHIAITVILSFIFLNVWGQVELIEYNIWEQIFKFDISDNIYSFKTFRGELIEEDSLVFDSEKVISNYPNKIDFDYEDSINFLVASRCLRKSYGGKILYNQQIDYIRISWFKENNPTIFLFNDLNNEKIDCKITVGDGMFFLHGNVLIDTTLTLSLKQTKRILEQFNSFNINNLKSNVECSGDTYLPSVFFVELHRKGEFTTAMVSECNIRSSEYLQLYNLFSLVGKYTKSIR